MEKIIPRWEWRTFGSDLMDGETAIKQYPMQKERESSEIYILSAKSNDNTKIRDRLMDIKTLIRVNSDGLEQWTPILKAGFPISITDLAIVFKAFNLPLPSFDKDEYSYQEYLEEIIKSQPDLRMVDVFKKRYAYTIDDCIVEIADVTFNQKPLKTIAVEHPDPRLVINTVRKLGLDRYDNINYIKSMKQSVGMAY